MGLTAPAVLLHCAYVVIIMHHIDELTFKAFRLRSACAYVVAIMHHIDEGSFRALRLKSLFLTTSS